MKYIHKQIKRQTLLPSEELHGEQEVVDGNEVVGDQQADDYKSKRG
jgi:hypothetical protein